MLNFQWLLIGGPQHSKAIWVKGPVKSVLSSFEPEQGSQAGPSSVRYESNDYVLDGRLYRVGVHNPSDSQLAEIPRLIHATKLEPLDEAQRVL